MMGGACQHDAGFDKLVFTRAKAQQLHLPTCALTPNLLLAVLTQAPG